MWEHSIDSWIVLVGALCASSCAIPGAWLLVRGESMLGDAISHAVLPGIAIAFLLTGSRDVVWMVLGAGVTSIFVAFATKFLHKKDNLDPSAAMGIVFTTLFALGLVLIVRGAASVDLDPSCVLYGSIELVPLDTINIYGLEVPRAALVLFFIFLFNLFLCLMFFKEWKLISFDPLYARAIGWKLWKIEFPLLFSITITCIASFEVVGSILVVAMMIIPPATSLILSKKLPVVIFLSILFGISSAFCGHFFSSTIPNMFNFKSVSSAGCMVVFSGVLFFIAIVSREKKILYF